MFNLTVKYLEEYSTTAGIWRLALDEQARRITYWRRQRR